jgi:hypothetical protein
MHGDTARAIDLWRQAILSSSESRLYGDVVECRRALNAAILEQPIPAFAELDQAGPLPNADRLLAGAQSAELDVLRAAHAGKLPDAFGEARRHHWEARLSGHLVDEREALELFGDVLLAAGRPDVAVTAWVMAGAAGKAANVARRVTSVVEVEPWARSPARACRAAAAQVIGSQARLYGSAAAGRPVHLLLAMTAELWTRPRIVPHPELDAVQALSRFGRDLPASAVDPVLELVEPRLAGGGALTLETAELLIQLYWAVPDRREDLASVTGPNSHSMTLHPGSGRWSGTSPTKPEESSLRPCQPSPMPGTSRPCELWRIGPSPPQPYNSLPGEPAHTSCASQRDNPSAIWSVTTRFSDAVVLLEALARAESPVEVAPEDLRPGTGPIVTEKRCFL